MDTAGTEVESSRGETAREGEGGSGGVAADGSRGTEGAQPEADGKEGARNNEEGAGNHKEGLGNVEKVDEGAGNVAKEGAGNVKNVEGVEGAGGDGVALVKVQDGEAEVAPLSLSPSTLFPRPYPLSPNIPIPYPPATPSPRSRPSRQFPHPPPRRVREMSSVPPLDAAGGEGSALVKVQNGEAEVIGSIPRPLSLSLARSRMCSLSHTHSLALSFSHTDTYLQLPRSPAVARSFGEAGVLSSTRDEPNRVGCGHRFCTRSTSRECTSLLFHPRSTTDLVHFVPVVALVAALQW